MNANLFEEFIQTGLDLTYLSGHLSGMIQGLTQNLDETKAIEFVSKVKPTHIANLAQVVAALTNEEPTGELKRIIGKYNNPVDPTIQ